jgi:hypothetical protein
MMSHLCNRCVREFLILARTWFAFGLPSKTGCDISGIKAVLTVTSRKELKACGTFNFSLAVSVIKRQ